MNDRIALSFGPRAIPLPPCAVAAFDEVANRLARRVLEDDASLAGLEGVAGDGVMVLLGAEPRLPWVDGVVYLGVDPTMAGLLLPTTLAPNVPAPWVVSLVGNAGAVLPIALVPRAAGIELLPLGSARPLARSRLEAFISETW